MARKRSLNAERQRLENQRTGTETGDCGGPISPSVPGASVREDYSADGNAWSFLPHEHARSRAYRWSEDGLAGYQRRRPAPLPGAGAVERPRPDPQGARLRPDRPAGQPRRRRQGILLLPRRRPEPQLAALALQVPPGGVPVPAAGRRERPALAAATRRSACSTAGAFDDDRYFDVEVYYAKASPTEIHMRIVAHNRGPETAPLHLLPTLWFRNTWSWDMGRDAAAASAPRWRRWVPPGRVRAEHAELGRCWLYRPPAGAPAVHRERDQRRPAVGRQQPRPPRQGRVPPADRRRRGGRGRSGQPQGSKFAAWHIFAVPARPEVRLDLVLSAEPMATPFSRAEVIFSSAAAPRPTSSTTTCCPTPRPTTTGSCARRWPA